MDRILRFWRRTWKFVSRKSRIKKAIRKASRVEVRGMVEHNYCGVRDGVYGG